MSRTGTRGRRALIVLAALALVAFPAAAQDSAAGTTRTGSENEDQGPRATITDRFDVAVEVSDIGIYEPSSGLLASGKGSRLSELRLWHGAHEILIDLGRVKAIEVHQGELDEKNELVWVTVTLLSGESQKGKVESTLELRGEIPFGGYRIRIDRVKSVVFGG